MRVLLKELVFPQPEIKMTPKFKYDFYIKEANPEGVAELLPILKEFYSRYPTGNEVGEALHQLRREFNLIEEVAKKKQRIKALEDELDDLDA